MAISAELKQQLFALPDEERLALGQELLDSVELDDDLELDEEELRQLHESLDRGEDDLANGRVTPAREFLQELRARSTPR
jgi:hypothetical protein